MKKILTIFFAILFVFVVATMAVTAAKIDIDDKGIHYSNLLDFNKETNQLWATQNEDGTWAGIEINAYEQPRDADGKINSPILSTEYSSYAARKWELIEDGEVLRVKSTDASVYPGMVFVMEAAHNGDFPVGQESGSPARAEYFKIRVRNLSACDQIAFGFTMNHTNNGKFVLATVSELTVDANGKKYESNGVWETYVFSMYDINMNTNYDDLLYDSTKEDATPTSRWPGKLYELLIFPFGFNVTDGTGNYPGATVDFDYIVLGSKDYVTNYQSALEIKEANIEKLELVSAPTKTNYVVGDDFDQTGLELLATFKDGTTETLTTASASVAAVETATINEVTFSYGAATVTVPINVVDITSIEMSAFAEDQTFELAELEDGFIKDGYEVTVTYADGSKGVIDNSKMKYTGDFSTAGKATITVWYFGKSTTFEVDLIQVADINITPTKTYRYGKAPQISDFDIEFVYSDGTKISSDDATIELTYNEDEIKKTSVKAPGKVTVTVTATNEDYGLNFTKEVEIEVETPAGVEVTKPPKKTVYQPNEAFDTTGMEVKLIYNDANGKTSSVKVDPKDYTCRVSTATPGQKNVTIRTEIPGLDEIFSSAKLKTTITVEGEVVTTTTESTTTTTPGGSSSDFNILPIIIIVAAVVVLGGVVAVVIVVAKKKKK